jgi:hypothetical protein
MGEDKGGGDCPCFTLPWPLPSREGNPIGCNSSPTKGRGILAYLRKDDGFLLWSSTVSVGKTRANRVCSSIAAHYLEIASLYPQNKNIFVGSFSPLRQLCIDCLQELVTT